LENETKKRNIPAWAWVIGCLGLVVACAVVIALGAAGLAVFTFSNSQADSRPVVVAVETAVIEEEAGRADANPVPESSASLPTPLPPTPIPEVQVTVTSEPDASAPDGQESIPAISDPYAAERAAIEANVAAIRQLTPKEPVSPVLLTSAELRQRLEEDLLEEYDPGQARNDAITLSAFNFLPADFDLYNFVLDLLTEQITAYYDPQTDEFVIISDDGDFGPLEQVAHAHEYMHALQDQYYNLELLDDDTLNSDTLFALQALAEGEATFVQTQFMIGGHFEAGELLALVQESLTIATPVLDGAPPVIARELEFPYLGGLEFVQALYAQGGYEAVGAAWDNLPQSTEQILHPQRYLAGDAPQPVGVAPLGETLGAGWLLVDEDTLGEFYLRQYLSQQLAGDDVDQVATGWGGDRYAVYWHEDNQDLVLVLKVVWDTPADAAEFAESFPQYPEGLYAGALQSPLEDGRCWSGADTICLVAAGDETLVIRAPDVETAGRVAAVQRAAG
jgi:hypothetical protein